MPSPVGHTLLGLAVGIAFRLPRGPARDPRRLRAGALPLLGAIVLANAPDLDYVPGIVAGDLNAFHHGYTHSLGWIALVACGVWAVWKGIDARAGWREAAFVFAAMGSHLLADWLTADGRPPYGIMALWPMDDGYHISPVTIFMRVHKRDYGELFQAHNALAAAVETAWCLPLIAAAWWMKSEGGRPDRSSLPPGV